MSPTLESPDAWCCAIVDLSARSDARVSAAYATGIEPITKANTNEIWNASPSVWLCWRVAKKASISGVVEPRGQATQV